MRSEPTNLHPAKIPIVVGVTGHRQVRPADEPALMKAVTEALLRIRSRAPHSPICMLNSLAEGADLLCADAAKALSIPLLVALPTDAETYTKHFSEADRARFRAHCADAETVFVAPATEIAPENPDTDFGYRQAGIYVASHSHVLLALWDGDDTKKDGCGTAAAVHFALEGRYLSPDALPTRDRSNEAVVHILCPRGEQTEGAGTVCVLGDEKAVAEILERTDAFNRLSEKQGDVPVPEPFREADDPQLTRTARLYAAADALSMAAAKTFRRVLALLALVGTALTIAFLLYDEAELHWLIGAVGAMLLCAVFIYRFASRSDCHRRYIECRVLAECLRVQLFLRYAGSSAEVSSLLPLTQRADTKWILCALCAVSAGEPPKAHHAIRGLWVEEQQRYHARAAGKTALRLKSSGRIVRVALIGSALVYVGVLLFEILIAVGVFSPADPNVWRAALKIVLGTLSAGTLFIANYYGKQSLSRKASDHAKMAKYYRDMAARLMALGETDAQLRLLAREELIENGHWLAYQSDNAPDIVF